MEPKVLLQMLQEYCNKSEMSEATLAAMLPL